MFYLLATILLNVVIYSIFKLFPKFGINTLQGVVANYCVCVITGSLFTGNMPFTAETVHANWFSWALLMGVGFISIFTLIAYCTRIDGITTTTIANKLSLVIPAICSIILYHDRVGIGKIAGILLAIPAIYLTTLVKDERNRPQNLFWPVILFIGSGLLDTSVKFVQSRYLASVASQAVYTTCCFAVAGSIGFVIVSVLLLFRKITFSWRSIGAGICLGIPNFFSIYFLIRMLNSNILQSSAAIPVLNIGIVVASSLTAILVFREKANMLRFLGLALSVIAILFIAFGDR